MLLYQKKTQLLVCYDSDSMDIGIKCWDKRQDNTAKEWPRDVSPGNDDRIQLILDKYNDGWNSYWFQSGPRGSIGDALISENGAAFNKEWFVRGLYRLYNSSGNIHLVESFVQSQHERCQKNMG